MGASITLAGESLIAQKQAAGAGLKVSRFIFANVSGLNPSAPVDRAAPKPAAGQIVYVHEIAAEHAGYVNPNQVVYSAQIGSDVGDWDFNWIGLETTEGVLFAVAYVPVQQKRRNVPPLQIGNNLTRNFLVAFDGALALTGITIDASTWQHDFTVRLAGIDERERLSNRDVYGRACFFGSSLQLEKVGSTYQLKPGTAYIEGIRLVQSAALPVVPPALPAKAWLDVVLQRELNDMAVSWTVVFGAEKSDYTDALGVKHYCVAIADLAAAGVTDRRPVEAINGPLVQQFAWRTGDYEQLRARATTKDDVKLGNIPNAISDDPDSDSSVILATTKAVKASASVIWNAIANIVSGTTIVGRAAKLATARRIKVTGAATGAADFDGSADVTLTVATTQATEGVAGGGKGRDPSPDQRRGRRCGVHHCEKAALGLCRQPYSERLYRFSVLAQWINHSVGIYPCSRHRHQCANQFPVGLPNRLPVRRAAGQQPYRFWRAGLRAAAHEHHPHDFHLPHSKLCRWRRCPPWFLLARHRTLRDRHALLQSNHRLHLLERA